VSGCGNINPLPFRVSRHAATNRVADAPVTFRQELSRPLGSTDPWSTAVPMEPFSTSVLQGPTEVFATTTKICSGGSSGRARARHLPRLPPCPSYSPVHVVSFFASGGPVWATRSSAIHFQGWLLRQVSCYTLLGGFQLPCPPSCCLKQQTPFVGSDERPCCGALTGRSVHPTSPVPLTKTGPLGTPHRRPGFKMIVRANRPPHPL